MKKSHARLLSFAVPSPSRPAQCEPLEPRRLLSGYTLTVLADMDSTAGSNTQAPLVRDAQGNLFGNSPSGGQFADGTIFELPAGEHTPTPLFNYDDGTGDLGINLRGGITVDQSDNVYSTAISSDGGVDSMFRVSINSVSSSVHTFNSQTEGSLSIGDLLLQQPAFTLNNVGIGLNIFGINANGGENNSGTVYELSDVANTVSVNVLASLPSTNTNLPGRNLVRDSAGDLFGTFVPGIHGSSSTSLFEVPAAGGVFLTLATFNGPNGNDPGALAIDPNTGAVFGTTAVGGLNNDGTIFEYANNTLTTLFNFDSTAANPRGIFLDSQGNLFGATDAGGDNGDGAIYELPAGSSSINILASFDAANTGANSEGGLISDGNGNLFGVTSTGGPNNDGAIFELSPPPPTQLQFTQQPQTSFTTQFLPPVVVDVDDDDGNLANFDSSTVTLSLASGTLGAGLAGVTSVQAVDGVATFNNLQITTPGLYTLQANDSNTALTPAVSNDFTINAPAPHLSFAQTPTTATAGIKIAPPVIVDLLNADFTLDTTTKPTPITLSTFDPVGKKHTFTTIAKQGVANFKNILLKIAGSYTLSASAKNFLPATSSSFTLNPTTAAKMTFLSSFARTVNTPFTIQVLLLDRFGNPATDDDSTATIDLINGPKGALLGGTTSATVSSAIARFSNLSINLPSKHYRLKILDGKVRLISKPFAVS